MNEEPARVRRIKYAYVVLALISVLCAAIAVEISLKAIRNNNHNFCELVNGLIVTPAPKPAAAAKDPKAERTWEIYNEILNLSRRLGCEKQLYSRRGYEVHR